MLFQPLIHLTVAACTLFAFWLFGYAAWHKLRDFAGFSTLIGEHGSSPRSLLTDVLALTVIAMEFAIAIMVLLPISRLPAVWMAITLLSMYILLIARQLRSGRLNMDCGCGSGTLAISMSWHLLVRNSVLILLMLPCLLPLVLMPGHYMYALPLAGLMLVLYHCCELLIANAQRFNADGVVSS
jgi:uncharacterized membrane protein YphA (DoxX/SURF4 family)